MSQTQTELLNVATPAKVVIPKPQRELLMISHANPEDDEISIWLASQLGIDGYQVWCDKAKFLVGEHFWPTVDPIIRDHAIKVIFVLSRTSNQLTPVRGFNKELELALQIERQLQKTNPSKQVRFVLPISVDDLSPSEYNIHFAGKDVLSFRDWAQGFSTLRRALQEDDVPKSATVGPLLIAEWWNQYRGTEDGLLSETHELSSNQFSITTAPDHFYVHNIQYFGDSQHIDVSLDAPVAVYQNGFEIYTFATAAELRSGLAPNVVLEFRDKPISLAATLDPNAPHELRRHRPNLVGLFRVVWERSLEARSNIRFYELANGRQSAYFTKPTEAAALSVVVAAKGENRGRRFLVRSFGRKRKPTPDNAPKALKYYHIGIDARPLLHPFCYQINTHVLFSDDGLSPWESKRRLHRYRRSFCSDWYNDRWRDCLIAFLQQLADGCKELVIPVTATQSITVAATPIAYESDEYFLRIVDKEQSADDEVGVGEEVLKELDEEDLAEAQSEGDF